jgi:uncharacterized protein YkwD
MRARTTGRHKIGRSYRGPIRWAVPVVAALITGGFYLSGAIGSGPAAATGASAAALTATSCPGGAGARPHCARSSPAAPASRSPAAPRRTRGSGPAAKPAASARRHDARPAAPKPPASSFPAAPSAPASASQAWPAASPSAPAQAGEYGPAVAQVLALINQARAQAGLAPYTVTAGLLRSASGHNQVMAGGCGLSHQCPGEPPLGTRETDAGVHWTAAGENIGEAGPVSRTSAAIAQAAVGLTQDMLAEKPPDDGHRLNILSTAFDHLGIAVYLDGSGTVWLTQDFSN